MKKEQYIYLSSIFRYPDEEYKPSVNNCYGMLVNNYPLAAEKMERFVDFINNRTLFEIEEIFNITFHIQAICYLDIGYVLFGEDYKRGEFLVNMKREQEKINNNCGVELPDNLPNFLTLLAKSDDEELVQELAVRILKPALEKMLIEFRASRIEIRNKLMKKKHKAIIMEDIKEGNIYQNALQALLEVVMTDYKNVDYQDQNLEPSLSNVLPTCGSCSVDHKTTKNIAS